MIDFRSSPVSVILMAGLATACGQGVAIAEIAVETADAVPTLPLKRGFYVSTDTPCDQASNATLLLVTSEGINGARTICTFRTIDQIGRDTYRTTEACFDIQGDEPPDTRDATYTLEGDEKFTVRSEHGWESRARYCPQSSLPEPWRDNDISDLID